MPLIRPRAWRGLAVCTVVTIPTLSAAPGNPDRENSTTYTQVAVVTVGAFQNTNETSPIPTRPAA